MSSSYAKAIGFQESALYYPDKRPGYTAWTSLFQFGNGDLGIAFNEIRQGRNAASTPPPLDFVEAMGVPYRYLPVTLPAANPEMLSDYVYLRSSDGGQSWRQTGRCPVHTRHYLHAGFPDSRMVRLIGTNEYRYEQGPRRHGVVIEESRDGGATWTEISRILDGYFFYVHKLKKLSDGALLAAGPVFPSFGPGGTSRSRHTRLAGEIRPAQSCFVVSRDGGHSWDGPHYILPGIESWEPDFVELPGGDLLFVNSTVQAGRAARQVVRRTATGYVNDPLMEVRRGIPQDDNVQGGITPETMTMTPEGLIVGVRRSGPYTCSNDLGENWYEIADVPDCHYQPILERLPDGRFLAVWHWGTDCAFGEKDMYIGTHSFRLEARLPLATRLTLDRELSESEGRFVNTWRATLTADGKPVAGREIVFRTEEVWHRDSRANQTPLAESRNVRRARTDEAGVARLRMDEKERIPDLHHAYRVDAVFEPANGDTLQACAGPLEMAYALTPSRHDPAPYPVYINHGLIMVTPETAQRFPDLADLVARLDRRHPDAPLARWVELAGSETRAREIVNFLATHHVIRLSEDGICRWYRSVHCGEEIVQEVRVCRIKEDIE
jgi:hypothetical protein